MNHHAKFLAFVVIIATALVAGLYMAATPAVAQTPIVGGTSGTVSCGTTATPIVKSGSTMSFSSLRCDNYNSSTPVYVGFSDVGNAAPHICIANATCSASSWSPDIAKGVPYWRVASGSVTIGCQWGY